jgi:hypothetical protein
MRAPASSSWLFAHYDSDPSTSLYLSIGKPSLPESNMLTQGNGIRKCSNCGGGAVMGKVFDICVVGVGVEVEKIYTRCWQLQGTESYRQLTLMQAARTINAHCHRGNKTSKLNSKRIEEKYFFLFILILIKIILPIPYEPLSHPSSAPRYSLLIRSIYCRRKPADSYEHQSDSV